MYADNGFAICKMVCGVENSRTMEKKKLSEAHAMLDPKESKFDESSSSVVLPATIAFFFCDVWKSTFISARGQRVLDHQCSTSRTILASGMRSLENDTRLMVR